jgi:hypothetical protein
MFYFWKKHPIDGKRKYTPEEIRHLSHQRISRIYNIDEAMLKDSYVFCVDLKPSFKSDFVHNEYDWVAFDIEDTSSIDEIKKFSKAGSMKIITVEDYCNHMVLHYEKNPDDVIYTLTKHYGVWTTIQQSCGMNKVELFLGTLFMVYFLFVLFYLMYCLLFIDKWNMMEGDIFSNFELHARILAISLPFVVYICIRREQSKIKRKSKTK